MLIKNKFTNPQGMDTRHYKGGGSSSNSATTTQNADRRVAVNAGQGVSGDSNRVSSSSVDNSVTNVNSPDAVKFVAQLAAGNTESLTGAIVDINKTTTDANNRSFMALVENSSALVDKQINSLGQGYSLAASVVNANKNAAEVSGNNFKYAAIAVAAVGAIAILRK